MTVKTAQKWLLVYLQAGSSLHGSVTDSVTMARDEELGSDHSILAIHVAIARSFFMSAP
jgi:hypothetical protein